MQKRNYSDCCNNYREGENINKPMVKFQIQKLKYFGLASSRIGAKVSGLTCQAFNYRLENEITVNSLLTRVSLSITQPHLQYKIIE